MTPTQLVTYSLGVLACVAPLALYLCWLATLNRRPRPTVVPGAWDFASVLGGLSGFLLAGGILLMDMTTRYLFRGNVTELRDGFSRYRSTWALIALGYLLIVGGMASLTLARRSRWLSVYNIDAADAERAVELSLVACGLPDSRNGNRWLDGGVEIALNRPASHATIALKVADAATRQDLERRLWIELKNAPPAAENAAAGWFTSLAVATTAIVVGTVGFASYILYFR